MNEPVNLEQSLRTVEPGARLVSERRLRKLLLYLRDHGRAVPENPDLPVWATREDLLAADVLPGSVLSGAESRLLLLTTPEDRSIDRLPTGEQLLAYWRMLFQAGVLAAIDRQLAAGAISAATCERQLTRFGPAAGREIRFVLETDRVVDAEADAAAEYRAFAAAYLDLHHFAPSAVADFFPSLPSASAVLAILGEDVDGLAILARSRPSGANERVAEQPRVDVSPSRAARASPIEGARILARALEAEQKGNNVRAAILRAQVAGTAAGEDRELTAIGVKGALGKLVHDLGSVLKWNEATQRDWRQALLPLLEPAATGIWPRAARCLYDLQKIPSDLSRDVFAVDLVEPIRTLGRRPVKRPLPHARDAMLLLRLRSAHKQLLRSGLGERAQHRLDELFQLELHRVESDIRRSLLPIVAAAMTASGFVPENRVEEVASAKVVAELLDRLCERGYLRFGDLRDAVARNQLKLPDLAGPGEWVGGDSLLRADTRLAYDLDGVYRRGEAYLRLLQRGSSFFFGTRVGRLLTLYLLGPFLVAFLALTFAIELEHIGGKVRAFTSKILAPKSALKPVLPAPPVDKAAAGPVEFLWNDEGELVWVEPGEFVWDDDGELIGIEREEATSVFAQIVTSSARSRPDEEQHGSPFPQWESVVVLGIFLLLVFHVPWFRRALFAVAGSLVKALRFAIWDVPRALVRSPLVVSVRYSGPARFVSRYLSGSLLVALGAVAFLALLGATPSRLLRWGGAVFALATVAFNTPWGWVLQERLGSKIADGWRVVRVNLLPGFIATVLDWFRKLANWIERRLYAVDEWLRFRGGDSQRSLAGKAILGLVWFPLAYFARFAFYLLIEPQINPVKHFPVVTVSHKVILPLTPQLAEALKVSNATALWLLAGIPGIFGFIAWELLANWRLYRANRPARLKPATIGSHGESMRGLLWPGFHSGTVPKIYRKLRRAARKGDRAATGRLRQDLHHAGEAVHRFVERELLVLLERDAEWGRLRAEVAAVRFGCQRVVADIAARDLGADPLSLAFENRGGRVAGAIEQSGWCDKLTAGQRAALVAAVRGLFDMAAVALFADRERTLDANPVGENSDELCCSYRWSDWVKRWEGNASGAPAQAPRGSQRILSSENPTEIA